MRGNRIRYSYSFFDKFSIMDKLYNSNDLVIKSKDSEQQYLMKQIEIETEEYQQTLATLEYQKNLSHEQLLSVIDYHAQPNLQKIIVLYEFCSLSLKDQFDNRKAEHRCFEESELWSIFTSLAFGLAYLQSANVGHGSVSLMDCFLNEGGFIKVTDPTCASSNPYTVVYGYFYSPEILHCLVNYSKQEINIFKSDVFSLGCCMLQLTLMKDISILFNYDYGTINKVNLLCLLNELESLPLSKQYKGFINEMMVAEERLRPDFLLLQKEIFQMMGGDGNDHEQQQKCYEIKSSISSLFQQKNIYKQSRNEEENQKIFNKKQSHLHNQLKQQSNNKSIYERQKMNNGKKLFENNMKEFFDNLKDSARKCLSNQVSQISETYSLEFQRPLTNNKYLQFNQKKKRKRHKLNQTKDTIEKGYINGGNHLQKILLQRNNSNQLDISGKNLIKRKEITTSQIFNKENSYEPKAWSKSQIKSTTPANQYTNPDFLKMMQAEANEILIRRNLCV